MCGIIGYWNPSGIKDTTLIARMAHRLQHRGPDSEGFWHDNRAGIALGHRRLAVVDLSQAGHQPMRSNSGRYLLIYNGEIYNFLDIRKRLDEAEPSRSWLGGSDTEVLLAAIEHWGLRAALAEFQGMFALALWDRADRKLFLARDRIGEKPLYYGWVGKTLLFGSELSAFAPFPGFDPAIDRNALASYLRHNYVPTPHCIYKGFHKLPAAHFISLDAPVPSSSTPECYWNLPEKAASEPRHSLTSEEAIEELDRRLQKSIAQQMVADVPVGSFLSGGFDSSLVSAVMQARSDRPIKTFTIGFHEEGYNEAIHAKAVATHLGTDHTEQYVTGKQALDVVDLLPSMWSEPFSDSSQIPTFLVCQLARKDVTVSLSGDGGDELFYGYGRYELTRRLWANISRIPAPLRDLTVNVLDRMQGPFAKRALTPILGARRGLVASDRIGKVSNLLRERNQTEFYRGMVSHLRKPNDLVIGASELPTFFDKNRRIDSIDSLEQQMMLIDAMTYLPDDILTKVDRASMAVSLESRIPLLDHNLIEFAMSLPQDMKYKNGNGKWLLRQVLYRYVPEKIMNRPKMGFGVPLESWLRGPLKEWGEALLSEETLRADGFFDPAPIRKMWVEHQNMERRWHAYLWDILMFQAWYHHPNRIN